MTITNPEYWCFPYEEALRSYCDFADEVIVVDGGSTDGSLEKIKAISDKIKIYYLDWPWDFKQREFALHLNYGLAKATGDWVLKFDIDFVLHQDDMKGIRNKLEIPTKAIVASYNRFNILNRFEYFNKGELKWGIHKGLVGDKVQYGRQVDFENSDWCQPVIVEKIIDDVPYGRTPDKNETLRLGDMGYNYDCIFRSKDKCKKWFTRLAKAFREDNKMALYGMDDDSAWEQWKKIRYWQKERYDIKPITIKQHPKYIRNKLENMTPDMWGYNNWNWEL